MLLITELFALSESIRSGGKRCGAAQNHNTNLTVRSYVMKRRKTDEHLPQTLREAEH